GQCVASPGSSISVVATGNLVESGSPAFGSATTAGNLLVAVANTNDSSSTFPITVTGAGWTRAGFRGGPYGWESIWYKPNSGAGEAPPVFNSGGSDTWSQVLEVSGAATSAPLLQVVGNASDAPSWTATFAALDSQPGDLIVGTGYWNGS